MKSGIHGQILKVIRSMCEQLKACVSTDNGLTEWFKCVISIRQGCMLSPLLFAFYLSNEFIELLRSDDCRLIFVSECFQDVNILLYIQI